MGIRLFCLEQAVKIPAEELSQYGGMKHKWTAMSQAEDEPTLVNIKKEPEEEYSLYDGKFLS